jgi:hypothetical protein
MVKDAAGNESVYSMGSRVILDIVVPVPGNSGILTFTSITNTSMSLNWTKASDDQTPLANLEYLVYYSTVCNIDTVANIELHGTLLGDTTNIDTLAVTPLTHLTAYYFNVIVKDGSGNKAAYVMNSRLTLPGVPPVTGSVGSDLTAAAFNSPWRMVIVGSCMYVTDWNNHTVSRVDMSNGAVTVLAGLTGTSGFVDGIGTSARFSNPAGICSDGTNLYIGENANGGTLRKIVIATGDVTTLATLGYSVYGLATDGTNIYIANYGNSKIDRYVIATGVTTTIAGSGTGYLDAVGTAAQFNYIQDICTDGTNLYVSDYQNHVIRKIDLATMNVTTLAGLAGTSGTSDGTGSVARFNYPQGIETDGTYVYVGHNGAVRKINIATGLVTTLVTLSSSNDIVTDGVKLFVADGTTKSIRTLQ